MYLEWFFRGQTKQELKNNPLVLLTIFLFLFTFLFTFNSGGFFSVNAAHAESLQTLKKREAVIIIDEYAIGILGKVSAGKRTLPVKNIGTMLHEVVVFKLKEGTTSSDFKSVISAGGSLRKVGKMKGNMPPIAFGTTGSVTATFDAGNYLLLCFQMDKKTGQPHFMIGMLHEFTVI